MNKSTKILSGVLAVLILCAAGGGISGWIYPYNISGTPSSTNNIPIYTSSSSPVVWGNIGQAGGNVSPSQITPGANGTVLITNSTGSVSFSGAVPNGVTATDPSATTLNSSLQTVNGTLNFLEYGQLSILPLYSLATATTGTGSTTNGTPFSQVNIAATSSNATAIMSSSLAAWDRSYRLTQGYSWSNVHGFSIVCAPGYIFSYPSAVDRVTLGKGSAAVGALTTRGVGFKFYNVGNVTTTAGCYYNGTAGNDSVTLTAPTFSDVYQIHSYSVLSYGNGTVNWFVDNVNVGNTTLGPTGSTSGGNTYFVIETSDLGPDTINGNSPGMDFQTPYIINN